MEQQKNIIITNTLKGIGSNLYKDYLGHALCTEGSCRIIFNGQEFKMQKGDLLIVRKGKLIERDVRPVQAQELMLLVTISPKKHYLRNPYFGLFYP